MNILYISPYVPSVHACHAGGVLMGKEVETIREKNNLYLISFINNDNDKQLAKEYADNEAEFFEIKKWQMCLKAILHPFTPNLFAIRIDKRFEKRVCNIIKEKQIDAIHADYTAMGYYQIVKKYFPKIQFNMVEHDVVQQSYKRQAEHAGGLRKIYYKWQLSLVKKKELKYCKRADAVFVLNDKDKKLLFDYYGLDKAVYKINPYYGVDIEASQNNLEQNDEKEKNSICFVGQMGRAENKRAALRLIRIFSNINLKNKKLYIIGANPDDELLKFHGGSIVITGFVDDINAAIAKCKIGVFPLEEGAGIKFKVLLALALGLPVVTTAVGAEGIDENGNIIDLAETDEEITKCILKLLADESYYTDKRNKTAEYVRNHFGWNETEKIFDKVYL